MTETVFVFQNGETLKAGAPKRLSLHRSADTPADSLTMTLSGAMLEGRGVPLFVRLYRDGALLFDGIPDEYTLKKSSGGAESFFSCRSRAAVLLDNEILPCTLRMPSLRLLERRFLQPLGLTVAAGDFSLKPGALVFEKGTCVWTALVRFGTEFLGVTPYCLKQGSPVFAPRVPGRVQIQKPLSVEVRHRPYSCVSRVTVQSAVSGAYAAVYDNPRAGGVLRERYLSAYAKKAPEALIADGERDRFSVCVTVADYAKGTPGDRCDLSRFSAGLSEMELRDITYTVGEKGAETRLIFSPCNEKEA